MTKPLRVLMIQPSDEDAARLVNELRRGGREINHQRVDSARDLAAALEHGEWHVAISHSELPALNACEALEMLKASELDLPCIVVAAEANDALASECVAAGASDWFTYDDLARLPAAVDREVGAATTRRVHRAAERALERSETTNRALLESIPDPIYRIARDGSQLELISGGGPLADGETVDQVWPTAAADVRGAIDAALNTRQPQTIDYDLTPAGDDRNYELRVVAISGSDEVLAIARDITETRKVERQLRQAMKMEAIGRLAGGIAHDFNNILTVVASYVGFLIEDLGTNHESYEDVKVIKETVRRGAALTSQLLAFSRRQVMNIEVLDLNEIVDELDKILHRVIGENISYSIDLAEDLGTVKADRSQIEQIIMNLVVNARDAMPDGGKLSLTTRNTRLGVDNPADAMPGHYVQMVVSDTGVGIPPSVVADIFEPFFTTKEKGKGTGLGLSTVYGIVKQSGGEILVQSEIDKGTTFIIYLPRIDGRAERRLATRAVPAIDPGAQRTILVVEDDEVVRRATCRILRGHGYDVLEAEDPMIAPKLCDDHEGEIHLLVTDVVMPNISGTKLALQLTAVRPKMRVLYMSGYSDDEISQHGEMEGVAMMQKPFTASQLLQHVREMLLTAPS